MVNKVSHAYTSDGKPVKVETHSHFAKAISIKGIRKDIKKVNGFNAKFAVFITSLVGSMWCAYIFAALALWGLPNAIKTGGMGFVPWLAQTFLQLVLLSVIMVGQSVQSTAAESRAIKTFEDTELIVDRLDTETEGGIKEIIDRIDKLEKNLYKKFAG
jgi:hypothetical protein